MKKHFLRNYFKNRRRKLSSKRLKKLSKNICKKLADYISKSYPEQSNILIYDPLAGEVDILYLLPLLPQMNFCLPRVLAKKQMEAVPFSQIDQLIPHKFATRTPPKENKAISSNQIQVIILPGLAFQTNGARLGFGGGYYDRYLLENSSEKIGVCFRYQIVIDLKIPMHSHDIFMDRIVFH